MVRTMLARRALHSTVPTLRSAHERATGPCTSVVLLVLAILLGFVNLASDASRDERSSRVGANHGAGPVAQLKLSASVTLSSLVEAGRERRVSVRVPDEMGCGFAVADPAVE